MKEDRAYLIYINESIANIRDLTALGRDTFMSAKHDQAAALYYLQTMAESTQRLSDTLKANHPEVNWAVIAGFRNRLVHRNHAAETTCLSGWRKPHPLS